MLFNIIPIKKNDTEVGVLLVVAYPGEAGYPEKTEDLGIMERLLIDKGSEYGVVDIDDKIYYVKNLNYICTMSETLYNNVTEHRDSCKHHMCREN